MTKTGVKIGDVVIGDEFRIQRTYTGLPTGMTITKAWLTVKKSETIADPGLFQREITTSGGATGQITDADTTDGILAMFFDLTKVNTGAARPNTVYFYDVQVKRSGGEIHTLEKGTIAFIRGVTDAAV